MSLNGILQNHLEIYCPEIYITRLQAVMDVATGIQHNQELSITAIGRHLEGSVKKKKFVPNKPKNKNRRSREYLTYQEIEKLRKVAKKNTTFAHRNDTIILLMFRHALRVGEVVSLRWDQVDLKEVYCTLIGLKMEHHQYIHCA